MRKGVLGHMRNRRSRSARAFAQSDQDLRCPLIESLNTTECMNGQQRPGCDFAHVQDDVNPYILRMIEDMFSVDAAHIILT